MFEDPARDGALFQADGDDVDPVERLVEGTIERVTELGVEASALFPGEGGEAGDEEVRVADGAFDGAGPVLAGQQFTAVHPGIEATSGEGVV